MAKKNMQFTSWLNIIILLMVTLAIGGAFVNGMFLSVPLLKYLPSIVHQVTGWILIVGGVINLILSIMK